MRITEIEINQNNVKSAPDILNAEVKKAQGILKTFLTDCRN